MLSSVSSPPFPLASASPFQSPSSPQSPILPPRLSPFCVPPADNNGNCCSTRSFLVGSPPRTDGILSDGRFFRGFQPPNRHFSQPQTTIVYGLSRRKRRHLSHRAEPVPSSDGAPRQPSSSPPWPVAVCTTSEDFSKGVGDINIETSIARRSLGLTSPAPNLSTPWLKRMEAKKAGGEELPGRSCSLREDSKRSVYLLRKVWEQMSEEGRASGSDMLKSRKGASERGRRGTQ